MWQYAEAGISELKLIKTVQFLLNVQKFKLPTTPDLRVLRVTNRPLFIFNQLAINFAVPCASGQTHTLTSFGRGFGFLSDLAMCVAVKHWHFISSFSVLSLLQLFQNHLLLSFFVQNL
ncbi:MAG: hypothetical protein ACOC4B_02475 [Bacteroidota bacterium]